MKTREEILAWLEDLERVIDKSVAAMNASSERIDELEAALEIFATYANVHDLTELEQIALCALRRK